MRLGVPRDDWDDNGISLDIISLEDDFNNLNITPIIINDVADELSVGKTIDVINDLIRVSYESDELNTIPSCKKGCTTGMYNYDPDNPVICKVCNHPVTSIINEPLQSQVWMKAPEGVDTFLHPRIYQILSEYFKNTYFDLIEYLTNPTYVVSRNKGLRGGNKHVEELLEFLKENNIERGINYFSRNFDYIIKLLLLENSDFFRYKWSTKPKSAAVCEKMHYFLQLYRKCIFTRYLPFPSKLIMVSERGGTAEFIDPNMKDAFDAPKTIASLITRAIPPSDKVLQAESMKVVRLMASYFTGYYKNTCSGKTGMFRGQHGRTRGFYTGRAVIAPLAMEHEYDEIHTPWTWTVTLLSVHIENKLLRRGYTPKKLLRKLDVATVKYDKEVHDIINELIAECPEGGIPVSMLRNPTLRRGSNQYLRITKVLTNLNDNAIMMSVLAIKDPNADFDGDQLQVRLLIDNKEKAHFRRLSPHLNLMDTDHPNRIGGHITFHPENTTMVNNYLRHYRKERRRNGRMDNRR